MNKKYLTILKLSYTAIKGNGIDKLNDLEYLKQINLVNSNFEMNQLDKMYSFPALKKVYLFGTPTSFSNLEIHEQFQTIFQMGNYKLDEDVDQKL